MKAPKKSRNPVEQANAVAEDHQEVLRSTIIAVCTEADRILSLAAHLPSDAPTWMWILKLKGAEEAAKDPIFIEKFTKPVAEGNGALLRELLKCCSKMESVVGDDEIKAASSKEKLFLLDNWIQPATAPKSLSLCYYSDKAIASLLEHCTSSAPRTITSLRWVYERLGLIRSRFPVFKDVKICSKTGRIDPIPFARVKITH